jgi:amidohydrolase
MHIIEPDILNNMVAIRRDLHRHPELSWQETRTAAKVCEVLDGLGIGYRAGVAGSSVVAEITGQREGPLVALRADLDALPIQEETALPFASQVNGVMHACGHDGHTSMLLGAAMRLSRQEPLPLPVRLIFQPAEESGKGAQRMIQEGVLEEVAVIFGGHLDRHYPAGSVVVSEGAVNASSDRFVIRISGQGAHAARPHESVDAVVVGSLLVMALQTIVSREVNPAHPSVVSVGRFDAGTAANVISGHATLEGSIRAQDPEVRNALHQSIRRIGESVAQLHDARVEVEIISGTAPLINAPETTALARRAARLAVGSEQVLRLSTANMGAEDFSYYLEHVPGCYVRYGAQRPGLEGFPAHSSRFDFDEAALGVGAAYLATVARVAADWVHDGSQVPPR